ncbi:hypothetical protein ACQVRV_23510 (plasmid) [Ralstonia pseudosolanacearum]
MPGTLKAFRLCWSWMQHDGETRWIDLDIEDGDRSAKRRPCRIIPVALQVRPFQPAGSGLLKQARPKSV